MLIDSILLLVYRNIVAAIDRVFLIWQVAFPVVYIFVAGYAYSAMMGDQGYYDGCFIRYIYFIFNCWYDWV